MQSITACCEAGATSGHAHIRYGYLPEHVWRGDDARRCFGAQTCGGAPEVVHRFSDREVQEDANGDAAGAEMYPDCLF